MKRVAQLFFLMALSCAPATFADNPFKKLTNGGLSSEEQPVAPVQLDPERKPLLRWPVENYVLMGVLLSEESSIAILRTPMPHAQTYLVRKHDLLGIQDGIIIEIEQLGLRVVIQIDGEVPIEKELRVRNKGVKTKDEI